MKVEDFKCPSVWTKIVSVDDGAKYRIQNTGERIIWWSVGDKPDEDVKDGILLPGCQLNFQKVSKSLYVKDFEPNTPSYLYIDKVEKASE